MFDPLYKVIEDNGILAIELNDTHDMHNYWRDFDNETFIFSVIREPVFRTISEFSYWANYGDDGVRTHNLGRDNECPFYTKEILLDWLNNKYIKNYQSMIISNNDLSNLENNVSRINMLLRAEYIRENENKVREKILKKLGISHSFSHYPPDFERVFMPQDGNLNNLVNDAEIIELIKQYNEKDIWLYSQASGI